MVEQLLTIPTNTNDRDRDRPDKQRKKAMIKTYSFTTDEEENILRKVSPSNSLSTNFNEHLIQRIKPIQQQHRHQTKIPSKSTDESNRNEGKWTKRFVMYLFVLLLMIMIYINGRDLYIRWTTSKNRSSHINLRHDESLSFSNGNSSAKNISMNNTKDEQKIVRRKKNESSNYSKKINGNEIALRKSSSLTKKSSYRTISHWIKNDNATKLNPNVVLLKSNDLIEELRKELKIRCKNRDTFSQLMKITGLNKEKFSRFIYENDNEVLHLQTFLSLLDYFNLMILILPK